MTKRTEHGPTYKPTQDEMYDAIDEAFQSLARDGKIVDTGCRKWSKRTGRYQIVWTKALGTKFE